MKKPIKAIVDLIESLTLPKKANYYTFRQKAKELLLENGFVEVGRGSYCDVVGKGKYVVKFSLDPKDKFDTEYSDKYLKPVYISPARTWVIQPMADYAEGKDPKKEYKIKKAELERKYKAQLHKLEQSHIKSVEDVKKNALKVSGFINSGMRGLDIHQGNVGVHKGKIVLIDLDNQFKKHI